MQLCANDVICNRDSDISGLKVSQLRHSNARPNQGYFRPSCESNPMVFEHPFMETPKAKESISLRREFTSR